MLAAAAACILHAQVTESGGRVSCVVLAAAAAACILHAQVTERVADATDSNSTIRIRDNYDLNSNYQQF